MSGGLLLWLAVSAGLLMARDTVYIPLCAGLTIVTAISRPEGDYESIKTVVDVGERSITLAYSAQVPTGRGSLRIWRMRRTVLREDLGTATLYAHDFNSKGSQSIPGSTALGVSTAVLRALKRIGTAMACTSASPISTARRARACGWKAGGTSSSSRRTTISV